MQSLVKNYFTKQPQQTISALFLSGVLSLTINSTLLQSAVAAPRNFPAGSEVIKGNFNGDRLPAELSCAKGKTAITNLPVAVSDAVLQDAAQLSKLPISSLSIVAAQRRNWSDGCLGLGGPEVICAAVVVPGWLVTVAAGQQRLVYRTGDFGTKVMLDQAASKIGATDRS